METKRSAELATSKLVKGEPGYSICQTNFFFRGFNEDSTDSIKMRSAMEFVPSPKVLESIPDLPFCIIDPSKIHPTDHRNSVFFQRCFFVFLSQPLCAKTYTSIFHQGLRTDAPSLSDLVFALGQLSRESDPFDVVDLVRPPKRTEVVQTLLGWKAEEVISGFAKQMAALGLAIDGPFLCRSHEDVKRRLVEFFGDRTKWDHQIIVQIPDLALSEASLRIEIPIKLRVKGVDYIRTDLLAAEMRWSIGQDGAVSNAAIGDRPFTFLGPLVDRGLGLSEFIRQVNANFVCYGACPVCA
jgi:hypothetical protein